MHIRTPEWIWDNPLLNSISLRISAKGASRTSVTQHEDAEVASLLVEELTNDTGLGCLVGERGTTSGVGVGAALLVG